MAESKNRKRTVQKKIFVTEEENNMIKEKMQQFGTNNFGAYARKILIDGYVIKRDYSAIKELTKEVNKIGVNINQIAKRNNETNRIYDEDIKELRLELDEIWQLLKSSLSSQL